MLEDMRKYVRAGLEALSAQGAEDAAGAMMSRATVLAEQLTSFASGFMEWSAEARASLLQELRDMITRQVESMGLATKDDVEALRRRIDRLEGHGDVGPAAARSSGRRSTAKAVSPKTAAPKTAARKTVSPKTAAGKTTGRKSGSRGPRRTTSE
jgi:polyhydroxyalkanoate synthesis regulator phasin